MTDESLKNLKEKLDAVISGSEQGDTAPAVSISVETALSLVEQLEASEKRIEWLERKKSTIADLAGAAHRWHKAKHELAKSRLLHVEYVLDTGKNVFDSLTETSDFNRGYRAALYWFRSEIVDDPAFSVEVKETADAKD